MARDKICTPFLALASPENKFTVNTIEDMQSRKYLKIGDVVELNGYYTAGDGAGHKRKIEATDDGSGVQLANGLWANIVYEPYLKIESFGVKGDGITDDSVLIQKALDYASSDKACTLVFSSKKYLCENKLIVKQVQGNEKSQLRLIGTGYDVHNRTLNNYDTIIYFKNLKNKEAGFDFYGNDNGWFSSATIEFIDFNAEDDSNEQWTAPVSIGSTWIFRAVKCSFKGKNGAFINAGHNPTTYASICTNFQQCFFKASDIKNGFAIFPNTFFKDHGGYSQNDNVLYESCLFFGTVLAFAYNETYSVCMFYNYPKQAKTITFNDPEVFDSKYIGYEVGFDNSLYVSSASTMNLKGCYFEDYHKAIMCHTAGSSIIRTLNVENCHFSAFINDRDPVTGEKPLSLYLIDVKKNKFNSDSVYNINFTGNNINALENKYHINSDSSILKITESGNYFAERDADQPKTLTINGSYSKVIRNSFSSGGMYMGKAIYKEVSYNGDFITQEGDLYFKVPTDGKLLINSKIKIKSQIENFNSSIKFKGRFFSIVRQSTISPDGTYFKTLETEEIVRKDDIIKLEYYTTVLGNVDFATLELIII